RADDDRDARAARPAREAPARGGDDLVELLWGHVLTDAPEAPMSGAIGGAGAFRLPGRDLGAGPGGLAGRDLVVRPGARRGGGGLLRRRGRIGGSRRGGPGRARGRARRAHRGGVRG